MHTTDDGRTILGNNGHNIVAFDTSTKDVLWSMEGEHGIIAGNNVIVFHSTSYRRDTSFLVLDARSSHEIVRIVGPEVHNSLAEILAINERYIAISFGFMAGGTGQTSALYVLSYPEWNIVFSHISLVPRPSALLCGNMIILIGATISGVMPRANGVYELTTQELVLEVPAIGTNQNIPSCCGDIILARFENNGPITVALSSNYKAILHNSSSVLPGSRCCNGVAFGVRDGNAIVASQLHGIMEFDMRNFDRLDTIEEK
jgi:hypothetical protein